MSTRNIIMESVGVYHPPKLVSTAEILEGCKNKIRFPLEKISGIKARPMAGETEFSIDMAKKAVSDCFAHSRHTAKDIDLIICSNTSRVDGPLNMSFEPGTSIRLREHFGFDNAIAFDIGNACAGMFTGIHIVNSFIKSGAIRTGIVVSGEYITNLTDNAQKEIENFMDQRLACLTLGDAGAAVILEEGPSNEVGFQELDLVTLGAYARYCTAQVTEYEHGGFIMLTDSVNLTDVGIKAGAEHSMNALEKNNWSANDVQQLIMHQTSTMTLTSARKEINKLLNAEVYHSDNTVNNLEKRGNSASTTHLVALIDLIRKNKVNAGDKIVFSIAGSGITVGTALYVCDNLPNRLQAPLKKIEPGKRYHIDDIKEPINQLPSIRIAGIGTASKNGVQQTNSMTYACEAANKCIENSGLPRNTIDLIIYCGVYRTDYLVEPAYSALLTGELGINTTSLNSDNRTLSFDIFNGAIGFINACQVVQYMIMTKKCKLALIIASECENNAEFFPSDLLGIYEGASAVLLESDSSNKNGFSQFHLGYHTSKLDHYTTHWTMKNGNPFLHIEKDENLEMEYISCIIPAVMELLQKEGLELEDINKVFPPQISSIFISTLSDALSMPMEKFIYVIDEKSDLFSSSTLFAMENAMTNGSVSNGDIGLIINVGSGIQVGCAIYHF